jgi:hypothetical protein
MKTIFITSFHPLVSRNILLNDIFCENLMGWNNDLRVVIFCPDYKKKYFEETFKKDNVIIEGVNIKRNNFQDVFFSYIGRSAIYTSTLSIHRKEIFFRNKSFFVFLFSFLITFFGKFNIIKKLIRLSDRITISTNEYKKYFKKYSPDLVFSTDLFNTIDVHFLAEAKRRKVFTIGMIRSWDNITGKGLFRIKPDKIIVSNSAIKSEVIKYEDEKDENNIFVAGLIGLDFYINNRSVIYNREDFFRKVNLDPYRKTILFTPAGKRFFDADWYVLKVLLELAERESPKIQILVRCPPNDSVYLGNIEHSNYFAIDRPGLQFSENVFKDQELDLESMKWLVNVIYHTDMIVSYNSTLCIEMALFDKPIITIAFDELPNKQYLKSSRRFLNFSHVREFHKTGCARIAYSPQDLKEHIDFYLSHPQSDSENRKKMLFKQCEKIDGRSGERLSFFLRKFL